MSIFLDQINFNYETKQTIYNNLIVIVISLIEIYFEIERNMGKPTFYKEITKNLVSQDFKKFIKYKIFNSKYGKIRE